MSKSGHMTGRALLICRPDGSTDTIELDKPAIRIGRREDNDLVLGDGQLGVSRVHAQIVCDSGGPPLLEDLKSSNGTLLNGERVSGRFSHSSGRDARTQIITTVAGSTKGLGGDGGPSIKAMLDNPSAIALDADGNLYIAEFMNNRIRRVNIHTGVIQTVAGNGLPHNPRVSL